MVDEFTTSLAVKRLAVVSSNDSQQIKLVEEHWQQKSKRGHGRYTKAPDDNTLSRMKSNLLVPTLTKINEGLSFPILVPEWLDVVVGILLSIESVRNRICSSSPSTNDNLQQQVESFIRQYIFSMNKNSTNGKKSNYANNDVDIDYEMLADIPEDKHRQLFFIVDKVVLPLIKSDLEAIRSFTCINCNKSIRTYFSTSSPIILNALHGTFCLEREIFNYFSENSSDRTCTTCSTTMLRRISVINWPDAILLRINRAEKNTARPQKSSGGIDLEQFNESSNIGSAGMSIFDLVSFVTVCKHRNDSKLARVTKIKNKWRTNLSSKLIGEGEMFRSLYGDSRKLIYLFNFSNYLVKFSIN